MGKLAETFMSGILENQKTKAAANIKELAHKAAVDSVVIGVVLLLLMFNLKTLLSH